MKKIIGIICVMIMLPAMSITAFAGSIPEDLLHSDGAQIFFAEVISYHPDKENPDIEVSPVKVIKGDVKEGTKQIYYRPNPMGNLNIRNGNVYLFTYFDENNPTDIFDTTTQNTATLKLKNVSGDMWTRFEEYLNEGRYEEAELKRSVKGYEKIKNAKVLSDMFIFDENDVEKIEVIYPGDGDPYGCYVDKDEFFEIARTIALIPERRIDRLDSNNGVLIVAVNKDDERTSVWFDKRSRVGCTQYETSSAVTTQYDISKRDFMKLYAFLPEEATAHMPLENPMKVYAYLAAVIAIMIFAAAFVVGFAVKRKRK